MGSEATSLFSLLFGVPALLLAIVFAAVALKAPRGGAVLSAMLLASVLPVAFWARSAGYFEVAGPLLVGSLVISVIGLLIAAFQIIRQPKSQPAKTEAGRALEDASRKS